MTTNRAVDKHLAIYQIIEIRSPGKVHIGWIDQYLP